MSTAPPSDGRSLRASEAAAIVGGEFKGGGDPNLTAVAPLERAGPSELALLADGRYLTYLGGTRAGAILVAAELAGEVDEATPRIIVSDVHRALVDLLPRFQPEKELAAGIHSTAIVSPDARLGDGIRIGPGAVIGGGVELGHRVHVGPNAVIKHGCELGDDVVLHANATLYSGVQVGARSVLHSGVRVGVDGFGYAEAEDGRRKIPQVGGCVIGTDVEVGANSTIDRGSIGTTEIGDGVKIDNLVHVGHNVRVGEDAVIVAQVGVSGSVTIGPRATLAGQAGISGHLGIGEDATIAAQAGVIGDVPAGAVYSGYPARPHREAMRAQARLFRLPRLLERVEALEQAIFDEDDDR